MNRVKSTSSRRQFIQNVGLVSAAGLVASQGGVAMAQELGSDVETVNNQDGV